MIDFNVEIKGRGLGTSDDLKRELLNLIGGGVIRDPYGDGSIPVLRTNLSTLNVTASLKPDGIERYFKHITEDHRSFLDRFGLGVIILGGLGVGAAVLSCYHDIYGGPQEIRIIAPTPMSQSLGQQPLQQSAERPFGVPGLLARTADYSAAYSTTIRDIVDSLLTARGYGACIRPDTIARVAPKP
jgi:hypothetical protein